MRHSEKGLALVVLFVLTGAVSAQQPAPRFDVASIRLDPVQNRGGWQSGFGFTPSVVQVLPGGRVESVGHTLRSLLAWAYDINAAPHEVVGKQDLLETEFNISARAAADSLTSAEARAMLRTLLEERFRLRGRLQPRDVDGYLLMPARADGRPGPGLRAFTGDCASRAGNTGVRIDSPEYEQRHRCGFSGTNGRYRAVGLSMGALARHLAFIMRAPVSDHTGWTDWFTFDILADHNDMPIVLFQRAVTGGTRSPIDAPPMLEVFRNELGLKLVTERTTINDLVVERVEPLIED